MYPSGIFRKRKAYNIPVFISILPPLNKYIENILKSARELKISRKLYKLELLIFKDEDKNLESYIFELGEMNEKHMSEIEDTYLIEFEEQIRSSLLKFDSSIKNFKKLPKNVTFKILLHTTQSAFVKLTNNTQIEVIHINNNKLFKILIRYKSLFFLQHIQWLQESDSKGIKKPSSTLPITALNMGIQLYAENYT